MKEKELNKNIRSFSKYYQNLLSNEGIKNIAQKMSLYRKRLEDMYRSEAFKAYSIYPSVNVAFVYAVIAMCLELKAAGYTDDRIVPAVEKSMESRWSTFVKILKFIDLFPFSFPVVRLWNRSDHSDRIKDGSITYDRFSAEKDKIEYRICKCMYVEIFEYYGIRPLCKIFCNTDRIMYAGLTRHVNYVRHSDLSDGNVCFDEIFRK